MSEAMFVAEDVPGGPPCLNVRVRGLRHENAPEARGHRIFGVVVVMQHIHVLEIEGHAALCAVDFDANRILATRGESGCLERSQATTTETCEEDGGVIHRDLPTF